MIVFPVAREISIHTPRVGSDRAILIQAPYSFISIHTPRVGSDLFFITHRRVFFAFQSTLPVWGATND